MYHVVSVCSSAQKQNSLVHHLMRHIKSPHVFQHFTVLHMLIWEVKTVFIFLVRENCQNLHLKALFQSQYSLGKHCSFRVGCTLISLTLGLWDFQPLLIPDLLRLCKVRRGTFWNHHSTFCRVTRAAVLLMPGSLQDLVLSKSASRFQTFLYLKLIGTMTQIFVCIVLGLIFCQLVNCTSQRSCHSETFSQRGAPGAPLHIDSEISESVSFYRSICKSGQFVPLRDFFQTDMLRSEIQKYLKLHCSSGQSSNAISWS